MRCAHKCTGILWMCFCKPQAAHLFFRQARSPTLMQMMWPHTPNKPHYTQKKSWFLFFFFSASCVLVTSKVLYDLWSCKHYSDASERERNETLSRQQSAPGTVSTSATSVGASHEFNTDLASLNLRASCFKLAAWKVINSHWSCWLMCRDTRRVWIIKKSVNKAWCSDQLGTMQREATTGSHSSEEAEQMVLRKNVGNKKPNMFY